MTEMATSAQSLSCTASPVVGGVTLLCWGTGRRRPQALSHSLPLALSSSHTLVLVSGVLKLSGLKTPLTLIIDQGARGALVSV